MNRNDFNRFISGTLVPGSSDLEGIRELTNLFPWFHSAHLVLLRGLRESSDIKFESQLKGSALYVADREMLYHYLFMNSSVEELITAEVKDAVIATAEPEIPAEITESEPETLAEITESEPEMTAEISEPEPEIPKEEAAEIGVTEEEIAEEITESEPETLAEITESEPEMTAEISDTETEMAAEEPAEEIAGQTGFIAEESAEISEAEPEMTAEISEPEPEIPKEESAEIGVTEEEIVAEIIESEPEPATDTSQRSRDDLLAEIDARLEELGEEELLELDMSDDIMVTDGSFTDETVADATVTGEMVSEEAGIDTPVHDETVVEEAGNDISVSDETVNEEKAASEPIIQEPVRPLSQADLIDRFIHTSPRIERMTPGEVLPERDLTAEREQEHGSYITETLARIYVNQGYYTRAIIIYEKLTLQFPEKSTYFASRIEKIKELIK